MSNAFDHENTIAGAYGEFEPIPADLDTPEAWAEHEAEFLAYEADARMAYWDAEDWF